MRFRAATSADIDTLVHHRLRMYADMGHTEPAELERIDRVTREYMTSALAEGRYYGLLAEAESGETIGGGGVVIAPWPGSQNSGQPRRAWILNVYVEPERRRQGVARKIMLQLIDWCRAQGFAAVSLHASENGRPLYEQLGFKPTNEMRLRF